MIPEDGKRVGQEEHIRVDKWHEQLKVLIQKSIPTSLDHYRPISILFIMFKLFMMILFQLALPFLPFGNWLQHGSRKHFQCIEIVQALRLVSEKSLEWGRPLILVSIDLWKAFDSLKLVYVCRILSKYQVPLRLRYAILREICALRYVTLIMHGLVMGAFWSNKGLCQGSPEASFIFSLIVGDILATLDASWKSRGLGVLFGKFGGSSMAFSSWWGHHLTLLQGQGIDIENFWVTSLAFLDDVYFVTECFAAAQTMLNELLDAFAQAGLTPILGKVKWMGNKYVKHVDCLALAVGKVLIPASDNLIVLGSMLTLTGHETQAFRHRVAQSWACFHKWQHVLCSRAPLAHRVSFWTKVVLPSLLWGLQTLRAHNKEGIKAIQFCQSLQFRKMMRLKRLPLGDNAIETWLDWQIRTIDKTREVAAHFHCEVAARFHEQRFNWANHVARLGIKSKQPHIVHFVLMWRPLFWWREQQLYAGIDFSPPIKHPSDWGKPRRYENGFELDWMAQALNKEGY